MTPMMVITDVGRKNVHTDSGKGDDNGQASKHWQPRRNSRHTSLHTHKWNMAKGASMDTQQGEGCTVVRLNVERQRVHGQRELLADDWFLHNWRWP